MKAPDGFREDALRSDLLVVLMQLADKPGDPYLERKAQKITEEIQKIEFS